jgi:hypothetical protein
MLDGIIVLIYIAFFVWFVLSYSRAIFDALIVVRRIFTTPRRNKTELVLPDDLGAIHSPTDPLDFERRERKIVVLHPAFKTVFLTVTFITVGAIVAQIGLAYIWENPTANQQQAFDGLGFAWKAGIGAIFGLLGGKVT